jgi:putative tryptophan/tyrosine transport system substrate-binding protein
MRRREFIVLVGGATVAWPVFALAQQQNVPVIGILSPASGEVTPLFDAFRSKLRDMGYVEGRSIKLDFHLARGRPEAIPGLAAKLMKTPPDVIIGDGALIVRTLRNLTTTVPIVGILGPDPVAGGLVASLARPGGNITGVTTLGTDLHSKRIELLKEAVPHLSRLAVLWDRNNDPRGLMLDAMSDYAKRWGLLLDIIEDGTTDALTLDRLKDADAVLVSSGPTHFNNRDEIVGRITASGKPAIYPEREYVTSGGLMSYGPNVAEVFRRLADYVDRVLKSAKVADIPIEQVTRVEYVVNTQTAKALGLTIPPSLLTRADEVIE